MNNTLVPLLTEMRAQIYFVNILITNLMLQFLLCNTLTPEIVLNLPIETRNLIPVWTIGKTILCHRILSSKWAVFSINQFDENINIVNATSQHFVFEYECE